MLKLLNLKNTIPLFKKGSDIYIKKSHKGQFTEYCGGKVTNECIQRGKNSPDPKIRKQATFAANARTWKHQDGGVVSGNFQDLMDRRNKIAEQNQLDQARKQLQKEQVLATKADKAVALGNQVGNLFSKGFGFLSDKIADKREDTFMNSFFNNSGGLQWNYTQASTPEERFNILKDYKDNDADWSGRITDNLLMKIASDPLSAEAINTMRAKKGVKLVHKPFGHLSVLDDSKVVNPKTLKLK